MVSPEIIKLMTNNIFNKLNISQYKKYLNYVNLIGCIYQFTGSKFEIKIVCL